MFPRAAEEVQVWMRSSSQDEANLLKKSRRVVATLRMMISFLPVTLRKKSTQEARNPKIPSRPTRKKRR
jgi:hypothetical protein